MSSCAKETCIHSNVCMYYADRCTTNGDCGDFKPPQPKRPHREWIPCSEQLPSDAIHVDDMVLVCYENGSIRFNSFMDGQWIQGNPIAWMPLPEPYMKEGDSK